jgi:plasmid maintenance system antidote protein VapI
MASRRAHVCEPEPHTAVQLERGLGVPARFWVNAEANYRQPLVRRASFAATERTPAAFTSR